MSVFPKTRAAAGYIAGTVPDELARARAAILLARLDACDDILAAGAGDVPAGLHGLLRDLVLAVRDLAGRAWLAASGDDPDVAAFTVLEAAASPPDPPGPTRSAPGCSEPGSPPAPAAMTRATTAPAPARQRPAPPALRHGCLRGLNVHPVQSSPDP